MKTSAALAALALLLPACFASQADDALEAPPPSDPALGAPAMLPGDEAAVLALVGYPGVDVEVLRDEVGLDARTAAAIVGWRNGLDGETPTDDDRRFESVAELVTVAGLVEGDLVALAAYAEAHPAPVPATVEGVELLGWQAEAVVWGVNHSDPAALDGILDARAATGLLSARPFAGIDELGAVAFVGPTALAALRAHAGLYWHRMHATPEDPRLGGVYDRVTFDDGMALVALDIANRASREQLEEHLVTAPVSSALVASRPYAALADVAAVDGVGTVTMQRLLAYARSGQWR